jgi:hypothetical protein
MAITMEKGGIVECRRANLALVPTAYGNERVDIEVGSLPAAARSTAMCGKEGVTQGPGDITAGIMGSRFFPGFPSHGTAADVETKHEMHGLSVAQRPLGASSQYSMKDGKSCK